jgi:hypothetical protein
MEPAPSMEAAAAVPSEVFARVATSRELAHALGSAATDIYLDPGHYNMFDSAMLQSLGNVTLHGDNFVLIGLRLTCCKLYVTGKGVTFIACDLTIKETKTK